MRQSVALLCFLLGSSSAICFGLVGVAFIFWLLAPEHPELRAEIQPLIGHLARFTVLTAVSAAGFYGLLKQRPWRRWSIAVLALALGGVALSYAVGGR
jgi:hypothetical protein